MHAISWRALRAAHQSPQRPACRIVRHSLAHTFHRSAVAYRAPEDPTSGAEGEEKGNNENPQELKGQFVAKGDDIADSAQNTTQSNDAAQRSARRAGYGSGIRRASRNRKAPGVPPLVLPDWFLETNVTCLGEPEDIFRRVEIRYAHGFLQTHLPAQNNALLSLDGEKLVLNRNSVKELELEISMTENFRKEVSSLLERLKQPRTKRPESLLFHEASLVAPINMPLQAFYTEEIHEDTLVQGQHFAPWRKLRELTQPADRQLHSPTYWYSLPDPVYAELFTTFRAEFKLRPPKIDIGDVHRPDTLLVSPMHGGLRFLDAVVQKVANYLEADVIRLDLEDIAQIVGGYLGEDVAWTRSPMSVLGYGSPERLDAPNLPINGTEDIAQDLEGDEDSYENDDAHLASGPFDVTAGVAVQPLNFSAGVSILQAGPNFWSKHENSKRTSLAQLLQKAVGSASSASQPAELSESWNKYQLGKAIEAIIAAAETKRARTTADAADDQRTAQNAPLPASKRLIIQISDYNYLNGHPLGPKILRSLREAVKKRWYEGQSIVLVGTSTEEWPRRMAEQARNSTGTSLSPEAALDTSKTIFIPLEFHEDRIFHDRKAQIRDLNLRHVKQMIEKLLGEDCQPRPDIDLSKDLVLEKDDDFDIDRSIWSYTFVRRIAMTMLGSERSSKLLDGTTLRRAFDILRLSDITKIVWADVEDKSRKASKVRGAASNWKTKSKAEKVASDKEDRLHKLKATCTTHEKRLLSGVIDPADIHITFADVQAPPETIDSLKTLTSLSLIRPDSFSYGVLATDKIPGLLLYGPPGTGKTLLAKAVAKESGATMLEVGASEVNDMYVGEGEKNVKAVFTLAKKLSPCVVFIDEADALFGARGDNERRRSHRELINQFLREWDGMKDLSAFIMIATNRPFDLDEAVLRRLPRRILVDLPVEKDREAILNIHLKDEILDDTVSLASLAKNTPLYSGSDLKNLSVAAALACVKEENEIAAKHTGDEPFIYPPKRILRKEHFDKAMEEISASISEDMSTLRAIRKFDERYGDRKGRRKKASAIGFGGTTEPETDSEAGRVRKVQFNV